MCKPISAIIQKNKILFSEVSHSHSTILEENNIKDTTREPNFVKVELYPQNDDMFSDTSGWYFNIDQDFLPDWFVKEYDESRVREAVKGYISNHIHIGKDKLSLTSGMHWLKDCKNVSISGAKIEQLINSTVMACDNSTVMACDNSTVMAYGNSTVEAYGNSTVRAYGNSTVTIPVYSSNQKGNVVLTQNSTLKDCKNKTIYQSGDWKLELIK